jgi:hypothetical protein
MNDDDFDYEDIANEAYEGIRPDDDQTDDQPVEREVIRIKSLILLAIFILPTILIVIEVLTGRISGAVAPGQAEPILTPEQFPSVHF